MILDSLLRLEAVLGGAVSANQPEVHVDYVDYNVRSEATLPSYFRVALNSTTDVTILAAPVVPNQRREVVRLNVYNKDTATIVLTIKTDNGTTEFIQFKQSLLTLQTFCWEKGVGAYVI